MDNPDVPRWALELRHELTLIRNEQSRMEESLLKLRQHLETHLTRLDTVAVHLEKVIREMNKWKP